MSQTIPPWLAEKIQSYQKTQTNLQNTMAQMQQVEMDALNANRALEALNKTPDDKTVYKQAGSILVQSDKGTLVSELEEQQELSKTQRAVLAKQKARLEATLKEQEAGLNQALQGGTAPPGS